LESHLEKGSWETGEDDMNRFKGLTTAALAVVIAAALAAGVACSNTGEPVGVSGVGVDDLAKALSASNSGSAGQTGLWVTGEGSVTMEPDLALLNLGVEATGDSVAVARDTTATAMAAIVKALKLRGLEDKDIQTQSFNIFPMYEYVELVEDGRRSGQQVLVGYRVSNTAAVKIRDLESVGEIIDEVAKAGGNETRINGISFTVEDTSGLEVELRESAVNDALAKADHLAELSGVDRGRLVFLTQQGNTSGQDFSGGMVAEFAVKSAPSSSISGGELELTLSVQAVFEID
jgi:uncharacterized protein